MCKGATDIHMPCRGCALYGVCACSPVELCLSFPVAQLVEHGASNAKIIGSIPRESKS